MELVSLPVWVFGTSPVFTNRLVLAEKQTTQLSRRNIPPTLSVDELYSTIIGPGYCLSGLTLLLVSSLACYPSAGLMMVGVILYLPLISS